MAAVVSAVRTGLGRFRKQPSLTMLCTTALFETIPWGFTSFSAESLKKYEGYSQADIGLLLPSMALLVVVASGVIGVLAPRVPNKLIMMVCTSSQLGGIALIVLVKEFYAVLVGYMLFGVGYACWIIIPYSQFAIKAPPDQFAWWYTVYEVCRGVLAAGGARLLMMTFTTSVDNNWGWRYPWCIVFCGLAFNLTMLSLFGRYHKPEKKSKGTPSPDDEDHTYFEKVKAFYTHPIALSLLLAICFASYTENAMSVWAPTLAKEKFVKDYSEDTIAVSMGIASLCLYPIGVTLASNILFRAHGRLEYVLKWSVFFFVVAVVASVLVSVAGSFFFFLVMYVTTLACLFFPLTSYKALPELLELPPDITVFALSRFGLAWTLSGGVVGIYTSSLIVDKEGAATTLWVLAGTISAACVFWAIPAVWAWRDTGPVKKLREERQKRARVKAKNAWSLLRNAARFTNAVAAKQESKMTFRKVARMVLIANTFTFGVPAGLVDERVVQQQAVGGAADAVSPPPVL